MSHIPKGAQWFLADLVVAITVQGAKKVVVHVNTTLVRADSAAEAFARALRLGRESQAEYSNQEGKTVKLRFMGLRELNVIHEDLKHGAELAYRERVVDSVSAARALTNRKSALALFKPRTPSNGPDYASAEILAEMNAHLLATRHRRTARSIGRRRR